jgi:transcriptional regulator with XRE-family HTH domain
MNQRSAVHSSNSKIKNVSTALTPSANAHPVDKHVGQQIRIRRIQSNVTQSDLARSIGVSFQQVQKYENGKNRVSASTLYLMARSLNTPVSHFFEGLPEPNDGSHADFVNEIDERIAYVSTAEGRRLIESVLNLSPRVRSRFAALVNSLVEDEDDAKMTERA